MSYSDYGRKKYFKGDIIITDPCYVIKKNTNDWELSNCGKNMKMLGISNYLCNSTIYGDWSCTTFEEKSNKKLGEFCADAGLVAVFLLDEVLKYNPDFDYHKERQWTTTLIKGFDGEISIDLIKTDYEDEVSVVGTGNVNFYTRQTGF